MFLFKNSKTMATNSENALLTYKELVGLYHDTKWNVYDITGKSWPITIKVSRSINSTTNYCKWYPYTAQKLATEYNVAIEFYFIYYYQNYFTSPVFCIDTDVAQYPENNLNPENRDRHCLFQMYTNTESGYTIKEVMICAQTELSQLSNGKWELDFKLNSFSPISTNYLQQSTNAHVVFRCQVKELQES